MSGALTLSRPTAGLVLRVSDGTVALTPPSTAKLLVASVVLGGGIVNNGDSVAGDIPVFTNTSGQVVEDSGVAVLSLATKVALAALAASVASLEPQVTQTSGAGTVAVNSTTTLLLLSAAGQTANLPACSSCATGHRLTVKDFGGAAGTSPHVVAADTLAGDSMFDDTTGVASLPIDQNGGSMVFEVVGQVWARIG